jgi:hypothetical protein
MRTMKIFFILTLVFLSITGVYAQYGNGYGGGGYGGNGYGNGYGSGRNQIGSAMNQPTPPGKPKEIPLEVTVASIVDLMQPALGLDELQVIAVSNVLTESIKAQGVLLKQEYSQDEQAENFQALAETMDRKINQFLSKEQKEKYVVFKETQKNMKKPKEKSKSKKEKKEKQE